MPFAILALSSALAGCGGGGGGPAAPSPTAPATVVPTAVPSATPVATPTSAPTGVGAFVFQSDRDGDFEILQAQPDGSIRRLTDNSTLDIEPSVSRDGRIAFASSRAGNAEIFVLGPASTLRLTTNAFRDSQPTWSPDARRIAFRSARGGNNDIYIANSDGSPQPDGARDKRLTVTTNFESDPSFGADGRIYFVSDRAFGAQPAGTPHIFSMTSEGTDVRQITQGPANDFGPALSPDARRLLFASDRDGNLELYSLALSAGRPLGAPTRLTRSAAIDTDAAWTRDGRAILFASDRAGDFDIYRANPDGSGVVRLARNAGTDRVPRAR